MSKYPSLPSPRPPRAREWCRHYAFVRQPTVFPEPNEDGPLCALGCDLTNPSSWSACVPSAAATGARCPKREDWSAEERQAWKSWEQDNVARAIVILDRVPACDAGRFPCPACGVGDVVWRRSDIGYIEGECSTPYCFEIKAGG